MASNIVSLYSRNNHLADLRQAENALRILAAALLADHAGDGALDESEIYDALQDAAARVADAVSAVDTAGGSVTVLLRIESGLRIIATALFAEVTDNPARDAATLHDALTDAADRLGDVADEHERSEIARRVA